MTHAMQDASIRFLNDSEDYDPLNDAASQIVGMVLDAIDPDRRSTASGQGEKLTGRAIELLEQHLGRRLGPMEAYQRDGQVEVRASHWAIRYIAASVLDTYKRLGGVNFVTIDLQPPAHPGLRVNVSVIKAGAKSPPEIMNELDAKLRRLLVAAEVLADEPETMTPADWCSVNEIRDEVQAYFTEKDRRAAEMEDDRADLQDMNRELKLRRVWWRRLLARFTGSWKHRR